MRIGVSGCPTRGKTVGAQHLAAGGCLAGDPVTILPALAPAVGGAIGEIVEPAAGPAESCQNGSGAEIHRRDAPPLRAGDAAGRAGLAASPPRKPGPAPGVYLWREREYHGMRAVARAAGVASGAVCYHLDRYGHLDRLGSGSAWDRSRRTADHSKPIPFAGQEWPSRKALAEAAGISCSTLYRYLRERRSDLLLARLMKADAAGVRE